MNSGAKAVMHAALLALLPLAACAGPSGLLSQNPIATKTLEGNYRTLAACTLDQLARRQIRLRRIDLPDQATVRLSPESGDWDLSFINDGGGLTRMEMKSTGTQASDYALAIARACAA